MTITFIYSLKKSHKIYGKLDDQSGQISNYNFNGK